MKNPLSVLLLFILPIFVHAQDISGLWTGTLVNDSLKRTQNFEFGLTEYRGKITGYSYTTFIDNDTFYYSLKRVKAERKNGFLIIEDVAMEYNNFPQRAAKGVKQTTIFPLINDSTIDVSKGTWNTNTTRKYYSLRGTAKLSEQHDDKESDLVAHLKEQKISDDVPTAKKLLPQRENPIARNNDSKTTTIPKSLSEDKKPLPQQPALVISDPVKKEDPAVTIPKKEEPVVSETKQKPTAITQPTVVKQNPPVKTIEPEKTQTVISKPATTTQSQPVAKTQPAITQPEKEVRPQGEIQKSAPVVATINTTTIKQPVTPLQPITLPAEVSERKSEKIQDVFFKGDSLVLSLYDNGIVDGDTVSVYLNGENIFSKQKLKESATKKTIYITQGMPDSLQLVLFAENLGTIPPNTGLLTIRDGEDLYQVRFSADLKQNASILLRRRK